MKIILSLLYLISVLSQESEIIHLKNGKTSKVKILEVNDYGIKVAEEEGYRYITYDALEPAFAYKIKRKSLSDLDNPITRVTLAEFCAKIGLWREAINEYETAKQLDPNMAEDLDKKIEGLKVNTAKEKFEHGRQTAQIGKRDNNLSQIEKAIKVFNEIIQDFPDTIFKQEAENELSKLEDFLKDMKFQKEKKLEEEKQKSESKEEE
ncbi:MAG: hypothetical protein HY606_05135, partial [Planctomycetes bacterium]|nr:hypothetical protein [Planctomycetota bacterium]